MIGQDKLDEKILDLLGKEPSYPSVISRDLGVLRTVIQYRLKRLSKAGLIEKRVEGRRSVWSPIYMKEHNKNLYRLYKGREITQAYKHFFDLPHQSIVFAIQGSEAVKSEFKNLPELFIKEAHKKQRSKGIIIKGILSKKALSVFKNLSTTMLKSHIGRTTGVKTYDDEKFSGSGEIMSTPKMLLLANPQKRLAFIIKDPEITKIINEMFKTLFDLLEGNKNTDLNQLLKTYSL